MKKHWIAMNGSPGCIPDHCDVYKTRKDAIKGLCFLFNELTGKQVRELRQTGQVFANRNELLEVSDCACNEPWIHQDHSSKEEWLQENRDEFGIEEE